MSLISLAESGSISGYTVGRPEGDGVGRLRRAGQGADYLPLALDQCVIWPPRAPASASPVICACWANPILLDQLSPSALRLPHVQTRKRKRTNGRHPAIVYQHEGKPLVCRALTKRCRERYDTEQDFLRDLERSTALVS